MSAIPRLHLVSDRRLMPLDRLVELAGALAAAGVGALHLRERDLPGGDLLDALDALRAAAPELTLIVNDRVDVALVGSADGVQLGERGIPIGPARRLLGEAALIGRSVHDVAGARAAAVSGADYLLAGNVYATASKPGAPGRGPGWISDLTGAVQVPVIAIGGIEAGRVPELVQAGAYGVAVISAVLTAGDPVAAARGLARALEAEGA